MNKIDIIREETKKSFPIVKDRVFVLTNLIREKNNYGYLTVFIVTNEDLFFTKLERELQKYLGENFTIKNGGTRIDFESDTEYLWLCDWTDGTIKC